MAIFWFILFSCNALGTDIMVALTGAVWANMDGQTRFMIKVAIFVNWSGTIMAFISKQANRIKKTGEFFPESDTTFVGKQTTNVTTQLHQEKEVSL